MAGGAKGNDIWKELRILHAENIYAILDPQARGSVDVRSAVEELVSGRLVSSLDVANAVVGAATQHSQSMGFADISRVPRAAFIRAVLEVPPEWLSLSYGGTVPAVRSQPQLSGMSPSPGESSWHVQPKRFGGGGRAAAAEFPWGEDQESIEGLRQSLAQARQLGMELVSKINVGAGSAVGGPRRRPPSRTITPRLARSTSASRNASAPGASRFAAKWADEANSIGQEDTSLLSALERVADNEARAETWRAKEARSTARKVEKAREALRLAERDGLEAARRIEEAQARLRRQEQNGWRCALRSEEVRGSDEEDVDVYNTLRGEAPLSSAPRTAKSSSWSPMESAATRRDASPAPAKKAKAATTRQQDEEDDDEKSMPPQKSRSEGGARSISSHKVRGGGGKSSTPLQKSKLAGASAATSSQSSRAERRAASRSPPLASSEDGAEEEQSQDDWEEDTELTAADSSSRPARMGSPSAASMRVGATATKNAASRGTSPSSVADRVQSAQRSTADSFEWFDESVNTEQQSVYLMKDQELMERKRAAEKRGKKLREDRKRGAFNFAARPRKFPPATSSHFREFTGIERFNHMGFANSLRSDGLSLDDWAEQKAPPSFRTPAVFGLDEPFGEPGLDDEEENKEKSPRSTTPRDLSAKSTPRTPRTVSPATPRSRSVSFASQLRTQSQGRGHGAGRSGGKGGRARGGRSAPKESWNMDFSDQVKGQDRRVLPSARLYSS